MTDKMKPDEFVIVDIELRGRVNGRPWALAGLTRSQLHALKSVDGWFHVAFDSAAEPPDWMDFDFKGRTRIHIDVIALNCVSGQQGWAWRTLQGKKISPAWFGVH